MSPVGMAGFFLDFFRIRLDFLEKSGPYEFGPFRIWLMRICLNINKKFSGITLDPTRERPIIYMYYLNQPPVAA